MDRILEYKVEEEDLSSTAGGLISKLLKQRLGLTPHEISHAKFTPGGLSILRKTALSPGFSMATVKERAAAGDIIRVTFCEEGNGEEKVVPIEGSLCVLYEDEDILAIDKPSGAASHPSHGHYLDSISNIVAGYYRKNGMDCRCRAVGRLDKDTSGIMLFAKNAPAASRLFRQKESGSFRKTYLAVARSGRRIKDKEWHVVDVPLEAAPCELMKQKIALDGSGKKAVTKYRVLKEMDGLAVIEAEILTGRTHQIRAHLSYIGCPLYGDRLYGSGDEDGGAPGRTLLHAWKAVFKQPFSGKEIGIESHIPEDMAAFIPYRMELS